MPIPRPLSTRAVRPSTALRMSEFTSTSSKHSFVLQKAMKRDFDETTSPINIQGVVFDKQKIKEVRQIVTSHDANSTSRDSKLGYSTIRQAPMKPFDTIERNSF